MKSKKRVTQKDFVVLQKKKFSVYKNVLFSARFYRSLDEIDSKKTAIIISKKTLKTAVQRNRVKRRIQAQLAKYYELFPLHSVILVYPTSLVRTCSVNDIVDAFNDMVKFFRI